MGRRFVDMRVIQQRMAAKDAQRKRETARREARMTELVTAPPKELPSPEVITKVLLGGDLSQLSPPQKLSYYKSVCDSLGLNPLTKPFEFLKLSGKEVLYALRNATDQLRNLYGISVAITAREVLEDTYVVTARATLPNGRHDESIGAVPIANLKGELRSNSMMKAETKAKRRVTLSLVGLSTLDESEVESIAGAQPVPFDPTGEALSPAPSRAREPEREPPAIPPVVVPADLNTKIPDVWKPFVTPATGPMTGTIVDVATESRPGRKPGTTDTKTTVKFWPDKAPISQCVALYTFDLQLGAQAQAHKDAGERITVTAKETAKGQQIVKLAVAHDTAF